MAANRMNRDEFYASMAPHDDARLRKVLWTLYWRGNAQLRERIEDELRPQGLPKVKPKKEPPNPDAILSEVTTFVELAKAGAYMGGDRRVHHTERSKWRHTFRGLVVGALAALEADDPAPAQRAVEKIVDLACGMRSYDYFHSDDPVEAAKFVVSDAVAVLWESVLRHDGPAVFASRVPEQLIRWESDFGWTRRGYGHCCFEVAARAEPGCRLLGLAGLCLGHAAGRFGTLSNEAVALAQSLARRAERDPADVDGRALDGLEDIQLFMRR